MEPDYPDGHIPDSVTPDHVERTIVEVQTRTDYLVGKLTTVVAVRLKNGFTIVETATCVDPDNYSENLGHKVCMKKIRDKIWMLEGYLLQQRKHEEVPF
jgi:hypothetical protein